MADILIVAVGRPKTITADMVKEGVVVIDVGMNRVPDDTKKKGYRLTGDVHYESCLDKMAQNLKNHGWVGVEFDKSDKLRNEKEMLGLDVSDHPLFGVESALTPGRRKP